MSARLRVCSSRALSRLRALFHVGAWCLDPGTHVFSFGHVTGFGHSRSISVIVWVRGLEFARHRALLSTCVLLCCTQFVFLSAACIYVYLVRCGTQLVYLLAACFHVVMSCVNTWLMSFLISCVFMSCFAHGWWFVCWPCACVSVLCEHVVSVLVFCVPRAHVNLSWPHPSCYLFIDSFSQLFSLVTLIICSLYNLLVFAVPCGFVT